MLRPPPSLLLVSPHVCPQPSDFRRAALRHYQRLLSLLLLAHQPLAFFSFSNVSSVLAARGRVRVRCLTLLLLSPSSVPSSLSSSFLGGPVVPTHAPVFTSCARQSLILLGLLCVLAGPVRPAIVSSTRQSVSNEPHDPQPASRDDAAAPSGPRHRSAFSSSSSSIHTLRRTTPFDSRERSSSLDSATRLPPAVHFADRPPTPPASPSRQRASSTTRLDDHPAEPHPALRVSARRASAILYALEVGLRQPKQFTPDLLEENSSMSNLPGAPGQGDGNGTTLGAPRPAASSATSPRIRKPTDIIRDRNAREEARRNRQQGASPGPDTQSSRARQDSDPRATAARRLESAGVGASMRDSGYRSAGVSAGGATPAEQAYPTPSMQGAIPPPRQRERGVSGYSASQNVPSPYEPVEVPARTAQPIRTRPVAQESVPPRGSSSAQQQQQSQPQPRQQTATATPQARQSQTTSQSRTSGSTARAQTGQMAAGTDGTQPRNSNVSTFPHAFERWETLSSRWEGLTSYWIRKLENNPQKADINQEMARQITDLAAAGANLFHAVVELQRLRASSERKFQRWFYETRAQQEQSQEDQARLQQMLNQERAARDQDRRDRDEEVREQQTARNHERLLQEYKRELQIAKDEAKRAWEELGRREQAERERIFSLREGHTIDIGGVQVVPHGAPSRGGSQRSAQPEAYSTQQTGRSTTQGGVQEYPPPSPTDTDPFSSGARPAPNVPRPSGGSSYSQPPQASSTSMQAAPTAAAVPLGSTQAAPPLESPSARFYTHQGTALHGATGGASQAYTGSDQESDIDYEYEERGHIRHDSAGQPIIRYRAGDPVVTGGTDVLPGPAPTARHRHHDSVTSEELEVESLARERMRAEQYGRSQSSGQVPQIHTVPPARSAEIEEQSPTREHHGGEYEGRDYPEDEMEWAELQQQRQHHHPTRLSDVPEEDDERSRGSMSRPSRGSEGMF